MNARLVMPILAAASVSLLSCDRVPTADRNPGRPSFITDGTLDGNAHPAVVLIIMDIAGKPAFRCSGTIIAPKLVLTAGHCAGEPGEFSGLRIFNEADVQHDPTYPGPGGPNTIEATAWHSHPLFTESAFFLHDVGVVLLKKAVKLSAGQDRKSTRLNSSHSQISYAVFCLKKKTHDQLLVQSCESDDKQAILLTDKLVLPIFADVALPVQATGTVSSCLIGVLSCAESSLT